MQLLLYITIFKRFRYIQMCVCVCVCARACARICLWTVQTSKEIPSCKEGRRSFSKNPC